MSEINWKQCDFLGRGHYGEVRLYYDVKTGRKLAVKRRVISSTSFNSTQLEEIQTLDKEIILLKYMQHERIVQYIGCELTDDFVFIFMEYMPGGSVKTEIRTKDKLPEPQTLLYTKQILEGLEYLHYCCKVVHRDIKNDNILRDLNGNVKISDFGVSKQLGTNQGKSVHGNTVSVGTNYFMAPEVIRGQDYGRQADMWSLGCTIVEMLTGLPPWGELDEFAAMYKTGSGEEPKYDLPLDVSLNMQQFLKSLFSQDPSKRPTSTEALSKVSTFRSFSDSTPSAVEKTFTEATRNEIIITPITESKENFRQKTQYLKITKVASDEMAHTNFAFVHPNDFNENEIKHVNINGHILSIKNHTTVKPGEIALNREQRQKLNVDLEQPCKVESFSYD